MSHYEVSQKIRIGFPKYLNCLPVYWGFLEKEDSDIYELVSGSPAELNDLMKNGDLHISAISSIEYARNPGKYVLMPDMCLNSRLKVMSVNLFSKEPIETLNGKNIALPDTGAASHALLNIILRKFYGFDNTYTVMPSDLDQMLASNSAALVIGDESLGYLSRKDLHIYDLAEIWHKNTEVEFVFAVWVFERDWALKNSRLCTDICMWLRDSLYTGLFNNEKIIEESSAKIPGVDFEEYFGNLNYGFSSSCRKGLKLFYKYARELSLCPKCDKLEFAEKRDELADILDDIGVECGARK